MHRNTCARTRSAVRWNTGRTFRSTVFKLRRPRSGACRRARRPRRRVRPRAGWCAMGVPTPFSRSAWPSCPTTLPARRPIRALQAPLRSSSAVRGCPRPDRRFGSPVSSNSDIRTAPDCRRRAVFAMGVPVLCWCPRIVLWLSSHAGRCPRIVLWLSSHAGGDMAVGPRANDVDRRGGTPRRRP